MIFWEYYKAFCTATGHKCGCKSAKELLLNSTSSDNWCSIINDMKDNTIKGYIRKDRNIASGFAKSLLENLDKKRLSRYIKECTDGDTATICEAFKLYCPEITKESAIVNMIDLFEQTLKETVQKNYARKENTESDITVKDKNEMRSIVTNIQKYLEQTSTAAMRLRLQKTFGDVDSVKQKEAIYHQYNQDFMEQNEKLRYYASVYSKIKVIRKIVDSYELLDFKRTFERKGQSVFVSPDPRIEEYKGYLDKLLQLLHNY